MAHIMVSSQEVNYALIAKYKLPCQLLTNFPKKVFTCTLTVLYGHFRNLQGLRIGIDEMQNEYLSI